MSRVFVKMYKNLFFFCAALCVFTAGTGVYGEELKFCGGLLNAVPAYLTCHKDIYGITNDYVLNVKDGLLDQNNKDTLSLSYPDGMENATVWKAQEEGDHYCNGVCIVKYKDKMYCQWQSSQTDEDAEDTHICYAVSSDGGKSWSEAKVLPAKIEGGYCSSGGWLATEENLVAYINFWPDDISPRGGYTYYVTSEDGENWSEPEQVTMADGTPLNAVFEQDPHILENGRIVPQSFITHLLGFEDLGKGFEMMRDKTENYIKVMCRI